jgi:phosphatidylserine/phosphatidylglycerophosphate/cardiolipin synthase-like enzyme
VDVGIARTRPACAGRAPCREVEALHVEAIRRAQRWIYVENQYLTSRRVGDALCARLREARGPEVVIVGPQSASGWLEKQTMGVLRARLVRRLQRADRHRRLAVLRPAVAGGGPIGVHAKVMVVDDRFARVGSSNLANRSMGLDTELDVAIEDRGQPRVARAIAAFRDDLLAEHLGCRVEEVRSVRERSGSLLTVLRSLGGGARTLLPLEAEVEAWQRDWTPPVELMDPEEPIDLEMLSSQLLPVPPRDPERRRRLRAAALVVGLAVLPALWRRTPLSEAVSPGRLVLLGLTGLALGGGWRLRRRLSGAVQG